MCYDFTRPICASQITMHKKSLNWGRCFVSFQHGLTAAESRAGRTLSRPTQSRNPALQVSHESFPASPPQESEAPSTRTFTIATNPHEHRRYTATQPSSTRPPSSPQCKRHSAAPSLRSRKRHAKHVSSRPPKRRATAGGTAPRRRSCLPSDTWRRSGRGRRGARHTSWGRWRRGATGHTRLRNSRTAPGTRGR